MKKEFDPLKIITQLSVAGRYLVYGLTVVLLANLSSLVGWILHPEIPYFAPVHVVVGMVFALLAIVLCGILENQIRKQETVISLRSKFFFWLVVVIWTTLLGSSLTWFIHQERQGIYTLAMNEASTIYAKDLVYYRWASGQKGVFVPVTEASQPNPILQELVPDSTVVTDTGQTLTLVNPELMIRQVYELQEAEVGTRGHITSLDPIWVDNAPDPWEEQALLEFEEGTKEAWTVEDMAGQPYFRLMRPMIVEESCLRCHSGYQVDDIRGGISVSVPMTLLYSLYRKSVSVVALAHGALWLIGLLGILFGSYRIKASLQEKEQAEARLRTVIDHMQEGLVIMDDEGQIESTNASISKLFGYSPEELVGRRIDQLLRFPVGTDPDRLIDALNKAIPANRPMNGQRQDGSFFSTAFSLSQMRFGSSRLHILILRDITAEEQRRNEALRVGQFAALGELAAGVAHEINNPINGIINYAQLLLDDAGPDESSPSRELLPRIINEGERVAAIVKNLLSFARQRDEVVADVDLEEVIDDCVSLLLYQFEKDGIKIETEILEELPKIQGNPQHLHQVFLNLLSNARYALTQRYPGRHPNKRIEIISQLVTPAGERPFIRTTVTDYGVGIAKDTIDHIFDALFTTKPPGEGTGLGLGISKGLVRDHNGQLFLESEPGQYTTATVDLPVIESGRRNFPLLPSRENVLQSS